MPVVSAGTPVTGGLEWIPSLGVRLSFFLDGLSLTFTLLISGIGTFILLYTGGYLRGHPHLGRFFSFILMFMGSMQGLVVANSFLMLFVFWELTSITSFLLIGFATSARPPRRAALQALVVTGAGGLSLLAGLLIIAHVTGMNELSELVRSGERASRKPALSCRVRSRARWRLHQVGPVSPAFLAAQCHGSADPGLGLSAFRHDGEGRRLSAHAPGTRFWAARLHEETVLPIFGGVNASDRYAARRSGRRT